VEQLEFVGSVWELNTVLFMHKAERGCHGHCSVQYREYGKYTGIVSGVTGIGVLAKLDGSCMFSSLNIK